MTPTLFLLAATIAAPCVEPATELWELAPFPSEKAWVAPVVPSEKTRAVVLIPGLFLHPLRPAKATVPDQRSWQNPKSEMVKTLAKDSDVFAFGYAQTASADEIAAAPGLRDAVGRLRKAGYKDVVLIGHSAGGVIARGFAERFPDGGATKVIAVAAPFSGLDAAALGLGYRKVQAPFVQSLTPEFRTNAVRTNKTPLGKDVEFACVVCKLKRLESDGLVPTASQWPEDLQQFGVPIVMAQVNHFEVVQNAEAAKTISELVKGKLTRWSMEEVDTARKVLFGEPRPSFFHREK